MNHTSTPIYKIGVVLQTCHWLKARNEHNAWWSDYSELRIGRAVKTCQMLKINNPLHTSWKSVGWSKSAPDTLHGDIFDVLALQRNRNIVRVYGPQASCWAQGGCLASTKNFPVQMRSLYKLYPVHRRTLCVCVCVCVCVCLCVCLQGFTDAWTMCTSPSAKQHSKTTWLCWVQLLQICKHRNLFYAPIQLSEARTKRIQRPRPNGRCPSIFESSSFTSVMKAGRSDKSMANSR